MIPYAPFDEKQVEYIKNTFDSWLNVAEGGKRAGKNILNIIAFADCLETHPDKIHLIAGVTKASAMMNIIDSNGFGLEHYFAGRCRTGKYMKMDCIFIQTKTGQKVVVYAGGKDSDDYRAIKGNTYGSAYISEVNECHPSFVKEVFDRTISSNDRKLFFDLNAKPRGHWFYVDVLDFQDQLKRDGDNPGYNYYHFTIFNNQSLTNAQLKEVLKTYDKTGVWYRAEILGERIAATGRIYTSYHSNCVVSAKYLQEHKYVQFSIGIDVGGTDATTATLTGFTLGWREVHLLDGYYHKQGKQNGYTHDRYAKEIVDKVVMWIDTYPGLQFSCAIFAESADKLFRQALYNELQKRGINMQVIPAYKKEGIVDRIRLTEILMHQERFKVRKHLRSWITAYESATWDDEQKAKGEWVRTDDGSYPVDCLDSQEYAVQPFKKYLLAAQLGKAS